MATRFNLLSFSGGVGAAELLGFAEFLVIAVDLKGHKLSVALE